VGRGIARRAVSSRWDEVVEDVADREDLVEAIRLAHDLGHPPFGHNGEAGLQTQMKIRGPSLFEGNAQSFRIVTLLEPKVFGQTTSEHDRWVGLNLSRTTLRSMCKYPVVETEHMRAEDHPKFGIYDEPDDHEYFDWLWDETGAPRSARWRLRSSISPTTSRTPYTTSKTASGCTRS